MIRVAAAGDWIDALAQLLPRGDRLEEARRFAYRVSPGYMERTRPAEAYIDWTQINALEGDAGLADRTRARTAPGDMSPGSMSEGDVVTAGRIGRPVFGGRHRLVVRPDPAGEANAFRLRRYGIDGVELSSFLPVLESFGLVVVEAVPFHLAPAHDGATTVHIYDFGLRLVKGGGGDRDTGDRAFEFDPQGDAGRLVAALEAMARGQTDIDSLNRLVTMAGLQWWQVVVLRAYRRYRRQAQTPWSDSQLDNPLVAFPRVAKALVDYFEARFNPSRAERDTEAAARARALQELAEVSHLQPDQVLRSYLGLIDATVRTSYYLRDPEGERLATLTLKMDSARVPELVPPKPTIETFVHSPQVDGIHLRAGKIARGGIRWSDRPEDFRTEILGLVQAQVKKNAIIVPTGGKGGFVCRGPGTSGSSTPAPEQVASAYEAFIRALLDVTDNLVGGHLVTPESVVTLDGEDPYLVVAADRGTSRFSDLANAISAERHFWLGDAFASGGSHGYDHKAMGITARGTWVAVKRHFRELGIDIQAETIRVVGVGDMSGDVFGNGMLQSQALALVAAFDHRHIFIDPDPDPTVSYAERQRLARLPFSSWNDYDRALMSPGGTVWSRDTKEIILAPEAMRALGVETEHFRPPALIAAVLAAPVDLIWFGGIGAYVRAPEESDSDVSDHANDAVRITSERVRARVVAEGGNMAVTQWARIRHSRRGGRINADFIDNAAGVATSDREVNLKILLALAIELGRLEPDDRDGVLAEVEEDVAVEVLRQVDHGAAVLSRSVPASAGDLDAYAALIGLLEESGHLNRDIEFLPSADELAVRRSAGAGLVRPELAVLLAYAKSDLVGHIESSPLVGDPATFDAVAPYFPPRIRDRFADLIPRHRLYAQIAATDMAGEIVDHMGIVWAHETAAELGRGLDEVAGAYWAAQAILDAGELWRELELVAPSLDSEAESKLHHLVVEAVGDLARSYLKRPGPIAPSRLISADRPVVDALWGVGGTATSGALAGVDEEAKDTLVAVGMPPAAAWRFGRIGALARADDVAEVARRGHFPPEQVLAAMALVERSAGVTRLGTVLRLQPSNGRWAGWQARVLLDDLAEWRRRATIEALRAGPPNDPERAVGAWELAQHDRFVRVQHLLASVDTCPADTLLLVSLALRNLREDR
jgi:glutamate dehydrogenase